VTLRRRLLWLALYAVAMGWLESAVVVDLRAIFYPGGFAFPLVPLPPAMAIVEVTREAATLAMILAVAAIAAAGAWDAFLNFAFVFGVWDLAYYAGLRLTLRWPPSLTTPDILFLIPVPWVGPVLAPVVVSLLLVAGSVVLLRLPVPRDAAGARLRPLERGAAVAGAVIVVLSFTIDWRVAAAGGAAPSYRWWLFVLGVSLGCAGFATVVARFRGMMRRDADAHDNRGGARRMSVITVAYEGDLHCRLEHGPSGAEIVTDAPPDNHGKGGAFSPTDLLAASLGSCIMTVMGIYARRKEIDLRGSSVTVTKEMVHDPLRRVGRLAVVIDLPATVDPGLRPALENAAHTCPVERSLHPDIELDVQFRYGQA
jgi:putative redox protein